MCARECVDVRVFVYMCVWVCVCVRVCVSFQLKNG